MHVKRLFRFRLRTLLVVVTALSVWLGFHVRATRLQKEAVQAVQNYGGWVRYDYQFPSGVFSHSDFDKKAQSGIPIWILERAGVDFFHSVVQVNLNYTNDGGGRQENHNASDDALQHLQGFPNLRILLLADRQATDSSMKHLARLKKLERLYMWDVSEVGDAGVAHLSDLLELRYIHLTTSRITDLSLRVFAELPKLEGLCLQYNHLSDEGLILLAESRKLEELWVCGENDRENEITDAGLRSLDKLTNLTEFGVQHTHVTADGMEAFLQAHPGCRIIHQ
ncbi:MAG: hypothetical protein ACR2NU_11690 [Aeoliella sp.]